MLGHSQLQSYFHLVDNCQIPADEEGDGQLVIYSWPLHHSVHQLMGLGKRFHDHRVGSSNLTWLERSALAVWIMELALWISVCLWCGHVKEWGLPHPLADDLPHSFQEVAVIWKRTVLSGCLLSGGADADLFKPCPSSWISWDYGISLSSYSLLCI